MGYYLLFRSKKDEKAGYRREAWNRKNYATKKKAIEVMNKAITKYKNDKYVTDVKKQHFTIVKKPSQEEQTNAFGMPVFMPRIKY